MTVADEPVVDHELVGLVLEVGVPLERRHALQHGHLGAEINERDLGVARGQEPLGARLQIVRTTDLALTALDGGAENSVRLGHVCVLSVCCRVVHHRLHPYSSISSSEVKRFFWSRASRSGRSNLPRTHQP